MLVARLLRVVLVDLLEQSIQEKAQVARPLSQGGQQQTRHRKAIEEIFPESARRDFLGEGPVRRCDDPDIHLEWGCRADTQYLPFLEDTKELYLGGRGKLSNLVEEECSSVGRLEVASLHLVCAREGTSLVAKEFGFREFGWYRAAVDRLEGIISPGAGSVDRPGKQLFPRARLTFYENWY